MQPASAGQLFTVAVLLSILCVPAHGQLMAGDFNGTIPIDTLTSMNSTVHQADPASTVNLLKRLGVDPLIADAAGVNRETSQAIEIQPLRSTSAGHYGMLAIPCDLRVSTLYLLEDQGRGKWRVVDGQAQDCFGNTPTYKLLRLSPTEEAVFVQHANAGHGSNELQEKVVLYTVANHRLRQLLSAPDYVMHSAPSTDITTAQTSTFVQIAPQAFEELRTTSHDGLIAEAERRVWTRQPHGGPYLASPFQRIQNQ